MFASISASQRMRLVTQGTEGASLYSPPHRGAERPMARRRTYKKKPSGRPYLKHDVYYAQPHVKRRADYAFIPKQKRERKGFIYGTTVRKAPEVTIYQPTQGERITRPIRWRGAFVGFQPKRRIKDCIRARKKARRAFFGYLNSGNAGKGPQQRVSRAIREGRDIREGLEHEKRFTVRC